MGKRYLTAQEAAEYCGLTRQAVYQRVHRRQIPFEKVGRLVRFDVRKLDGWMCGNGTPALMRTPSV